MGTLKMETTSLLDSRYLGYGLTVLELISVRDSCYAPSSVGSRIWRKSSDTNLLLVLCLPDKRATVSLLSPNNLLVPTFEAMNDTILTCRFCLISRIGLMILP